MPYEWQPLNLHPVLTWKTGQRYTQVQPLGNLPALNKDVSLVTGALIVQAGSDIAAHALCYDKPNANESLDLSQYLDEQTTGVALVQMSIFFSGSDDFSLVSTRPITVPTNGIPSDVTYDFDVGDYYSLTVHPDVQNKWLRIQALLDMSTSPSVAVGDMYQPFVFRTVWSGSPLNTPYVPSILTDRTDFPAGPTGLGGAIINPTITYPYFPPVRSIVVSHKNAKRGRFV